MRTIKLSHDDIEYIKNSLQLAYNIKMKFIEDNNIVLNQNTIQTLSNDAHNYLFTKDKFNGEYDV